MEPFEKNLDILKSHLNSYLKESKAGNGPVISQKPYEEVIEKLNIENLLNKGTLEENLDSFIQSYLELTTKLHNPRYLGHQVSAPNYFAGLGSLIDGITNNAMAIYEMGPAASAIEYFMIDWLIKKIGWTPAKKLSLQASKDQNHSGGVLMNGGSLGNLTALIVARNAYSEEIAENGCSKDLVVLVPELSHYSLKRAVSMIGIGANNCLSLPSLSNGKIDCDTLPDFIQNLKRKNKKIVALVANACSTAVGLFDDLEKIGTICQKEQIWLHVDGAHGASFLLSRKNRKYLHGIDKADSVIWDAHKMLQTPALCAALLFKNHNHLDQNLSFEASYLVHEKDTPGFDFLTRTVECTKSGIGLKLFMALSALGENGIEKYLDETLIVTNKAYLWLLENKDIEVALEPEANILCFRYKNSCDDQLKIRKKLLSNGSFYISTTMFRDVRWLRIVIINPMTRLSHIKDLIKEIKIIGENLN